MVIMRVHNSKLEIQTKAYRDLRKFNEISREELNFRGSPCGNFLDPIMFRPLQPENGQLVG